MTSDLATETYFYTLMALSQERESLGKSEPSLISTFEPATSVAPESQFSASSTPPSEKRKIVVTKVACGWNHVLALTGMLALIIYPLHNIFPYLMIFVAEGNVFAWGRNSHGELGIGSTEDQRSPVLVAGLVGHGITHIAAGGRHSVASDCTRLLSYRSTCSSLMLP